MREIFLAVKGVLTDLKDPDTLETIFKTVELEKGQIERYLGDENSEGVILFPAVFIRFSNIIYSPYTEGLRHGTADLTCKVVLHDPLGIEDEEIFNFRDLMDMAITDARNTTPSLTNLDLSTEDMPLSFADTMEWATTYAVSFKDVKSYRYRNYINANDPAKNPEAPVQHKIYGGFKPS